MKKIIKTVPLVLVYMAIVFFSVKRPSGSGVSIPNIDKIYHFIAYFTLGFVICISISSKAIRGLFLFLSLALGISLEFIQGQLPYRDMSVADGFTNTLGLILGVLFFTLLYKQIYWIFKQLRLNTIFLDK